jgi:hypothetical protein
LTRHITCSDTLQGNPTNHTSFFFEHQQTTQVYSSYHIAYTGLGLRDLVTWARLASLTIVQSNIDFYRAKWAISEQGELSLFSSNSFIIKLETRLDSLYVELS